jgi:hypothetical protein
MADVHMQSCMGTQTRFRQVCTCVRHTCSRMCTGHTHLCISQSVIASESPVGTQPWLLYTPASVIDAQCTVQLSVRHMRHTY